MAALRRRYGAEDDGMALMAAVDAALANDPALKEIVHRCDLHGEDTLSVARSLHFSERQFHRYRSFANEAIAAESERVTAAPADVDADQQLITALSAVDPERANALMQQVPLATPAQRLAALRIKLETGGVPSDEDMEGFDAVNRVHAEVYRAYGVENAGDHARAERLVAELHARLRGAETVEQRRAAFELGVLRRYQGRRRGRMDESAAAVDDMAAHAVDDAQTARMIVARAHLAIHDASIDDWRDRLAAAKRVVRSSPDVRLLRYVTMVEGYLGYVHGDPALALRNSAVATMAGSNPAIALQSEALHARAALALGQPWTRPAWTHDVLPNVWFQAELDVLGAFHALRAGDETAAGRLATQAGAHSAAPHAPGIGTYAAAVFAALDGRPAIPEGVVIPPDLLIETDLKTLRDALASSVPAPVARKR